MKKKHPDRDTGQDQCCGQWLGLFWEENQGTPWSLGDDVFTESPIMFTGSPGRLSPAGRALQRAVPPHSTLVQLSVTPCPPPQPSST